MTKSRWIAAFALAVASPGSIARAQTPPPSMTAQSAEVLQDGRVVRVTFRGPAGMPIRVPFGPRNAVTLGGLGVEHIGSTVYQDEAATTWVSSFLTPTVVPYGSPAPAASGVASALSDSGGATTAAFSDLAVANRSQVDEDGFTTSKWERGPGAPTLYVSPSLGDDTRPGTDPDLPLKTLAKAWQLAQAAPPGSAIRLARGEVHDLNRAAAINGLDLDRPFILEDYGTSRDRAVIQSADGPFGFTRLPYHDVVIRGIEIRPLVKGNGTGVGSVNKVTNLVLDDLIVRDFSTNVICQALATNPSRGVFLNRCQILDAWALAGIQHSQGLFVAGVDGLLVSQCVLDNNGRKGEDKHRDIFIHNIYLTTDSRDATLWGNVISRGGSHGLQARGGAIVAYNYFAGNGLAAFLGRDGGSFYKNVCEKASDIETLPRGVGFSTNGSRASLIHGNHVVNVTKTRYPVAFYMEGLASAYSETRITANTFHNGGAFQLAALGNVVAIGNRSTDKLNFSLKMNVAPASWDWLKSDRNEFGNELATPFAWGPSKGDLAAWRTATGGDAGSVTLPVIADDPAYTLPASAMQRFRDRGRFVWGADYSAPAIYRDFRLAFLPPF